MNNIWETVTIAELSEKIGMGPFGSNIKVETFVPKGVPIISGAHLKGLQVLEKNFNFITEEHAQRLKNSIVFSGDIIFTHAGNVGQAAMIPYDSKYPYYMISQRQFYMRCNKKRVLPEFVVLFFHSRDGQGKLLANVSQVGVPSIAQPSTYLKKIELCIPSIDTQKRIVNFIFGIEHKIELNNRIIANLKAQAQAIFKSWFVDFEPFQDGEFDESEMGLIPKGWRVGTIFEVAEINPDSIKTNESDDPIEYLDTSNITGGRIQEIQKFENLVTAPSRARRRVVDGDIVYSTVRPNQLHYGMINNPSNQLLVSTGFAVVRCKENIISKFYVYLTLTQQSTVEYFQQLAETTTSTFPAIRSDDVGSLPIVIPHENVSKDYHNIVSSLYKDINSRYQQISILQKLRDTLLPKLVSGEIEVPEEG